MKKSAESISVLVVATLTLKTEAMDQHILKHLDGEHGWWLLKP
jgi:hypothetical protein